MDQQQKKAGVDTVLGDDTTFVGKIESRGTLRVDGRVEGEITALDTIIIGPSGIVKANIKAAAVSVSGQINGNIETTRKLELHPTAVVIGDIRTAVGALTVEAGAKIEGCCTMSSDKAGVQTAAPAAAKPEATRGAEPPRAAETPRAPALSASGHSPKT